MWGMKPFVWLAFVLLPLTLNAQDCLAPGWLRLDNARPAPVAPGALIADMASREVVLLGEHHDEEDDHRWQLQTLAALHAQRPRMVLGFESFPRRVQPVLDKYRRELPQYFAQLGA